MLSNWLWVELLSGGAEAGEFGQGFADRTLVQDVFRSGACGRVPERANGIKPVGGRLHAVRVAGVEKVS